MPVYHFKYSHFPFIFRFLQRISMISVHRNVRPYIHHSVAGHFKNAIPVMHASVCIRTKSPSQGIININILALFFRIIPRLKLFKFLINIKSLNPAIPLCINTILPYPIITYILGNDLRPCAIIADPIQSMIQGRTHLGKLGILPFRTRQIICPSVLFLNFRIDFFLSGQLRCR